MSLKSSIKIENDDKILLKLREFINDTTSAAGPILTEGAKILKEAARNLAPVSKYGLKNGKYAHPPGTLRDSIDVGVVRRSKGIVSMAVGVTENKYFTQGNSNLWYARWMEMGTKERVVKNYFGHRGVRKSVGPLMASPFMRPALARNRSRIRKLVEQRLKGELFRD